MIAEKLRKAILQSAMQGKLTEQLPEDGDAMDLLREIRDVKEGQIKQRAFKKGENLPSINADETPFEIPKNWTWVKLSEVTNSISTRPYQILQSEIRSKGTYPVVSQGKQLIEGYSENTSRVLYLQSPLLVFGDHTKNLKFIDFDFIVGADGTKILSPILILPKYLFFALLYCINNLPTRNYGRHFRLLNLMYFPLPPLNEQKMIIKRLEKQFLEIEKLEEQEIRLVALEKEFPEKLKKSLLQAAMQGKLTEQLPEDGDARDLLAEIQQEKKRKIKAGEIKATKPLPPIDPEEIPYDIPENWVWTRLGNIVTNHGQTKPSQTFTYIDISSINNKSMKLGDLSNVLNPSQAPSRARKVIKKGDAIYSTVRPYLHNACIIDREISPAPIASTGFFVMTPLSNLAIEYVLYCLVSPAIDMVINDTSNSRGVAYPAISEEKMRNTLINLPPSKEQERIVKLLNILLPLSDALI